MLANERTGLATPAVFYFGSLVGDTGLGTTQVAAATNGTDQIAVRNNFGFGQTLDSVFDINRDGVTNSADEVVVRQSYNFLRLLTTSEPVVLAEPVTAVDAERRDSIALAVSLAQHPASTAQIEQPVVGRLPESEISPLASEAQGDTSLGQRSHSLPGWTPAREIKARAEREARESLFDDTDWLALRR